MLTTSTTKIEEKRLTDDDDSMRSISYWDEQN